MKKLFLLLSVITFGLTLSSCLGGGSNSFNDSSIVYIKQSTSGQTYGVTVHHYPIALSSSKINLMYPGTFKGISYSWEEENGMEQIGDNLSSYKVNMLGEVVDIENKRLLQSSTLSEELGEPIEAISGFHNDPTGTTYDDFMIIQYQVKHKEGEKAELEFYLNESEDNNPKTVNVDVRMKITGEAKTTEKVNFYTVAVNMSDIRRLYLTEEESKVEVEFSYYEKVGEEPKTNNIKNSGSSDNKFKMIKRSTK